MADLFKSHPSDYARPPLPNMGDLTRLIHRDPLLRECWELFRDGHLTLEQALVCMVVEQTRRVEQLTRSEFHRVLQTPAGPAMRTVSKPGTAPDHVVGPGS